MPAQLSSAKIFALLSCLKLLQAIVGPAALDGDSVLCDVVLDEGLNVSRCRGPRHLDDLRRRCLALLLCLRV
jgi:hypothetical protein